VEAPDAHRDVITSLWIEKQSNANIRISMIINDHRGTSGRQKIASINTRRYPEGGRGGEPGGGVSHSYEPEETMGVELWVGISQSGGAW
jgi:hypothetical protein